MTTDYAEAVRLLRAYEANHTERWQDWNGGNTGECPCPICVEVRAFLASAPPQEIRQNGFLYVDREAAVKQNRDFISKLIGPANPPNPEERRFTLAEVEAAARSANESPDEGLDLNGWQDLFWAALKSKPEGT